MSFRENTVKIVSTIGPASSSKQMIKSLIDAGVDIFRLNFSHGTHKEKGELVERIRGVDNKIGIMADIQGPKIRVGKFKNDDAYILNVGQDVKVYESEIPGGRGSNPIFHSVSGISKVIEKGECFFC